MLRSASARAKDEVEKEITENTQSWPIGYVLAPKQQTKIPHPGASRKLTPELAKC
jgi:hypothetical protein